MAQQETTFHPQALADEQYINLTTYRKNGNAVRTPVWFVELDGKVYAKTDAQAWKVKRIRNNSHVRFAPCDARGNIHGETFNGSAELHQVNSATANRVQNAMNKKYGLMVRAFDLFYKIRQRVYIYIEITPR